jgi:hypothetical protein
MTSPGKESVAELQGLYGPFAFPELLLQKLWWRREFAVAEARTMEGKPLVVHHVGRWNRLGGPDFREAIIDIDGVRLRGDVEVHLRAEDWDAHRHKNDRAYDGVILHVVLFPPRVPVTSGAGGRSIPVLALLPLLWHDLEEYATDEAIAALMNRAEYRVAAELLPMPEQELRQRLRRAGSKRWDQKVHYASRRVERLGWEEACHHTALEILGYRANRTGMLKVAGRWPLAAWRSGEVDPDQVFDETAGEWQRQGVRPANHPRQRLRQYARWVQARPDWTERLAALGKRQPPRIAGDTVAQVRRRGGLPAYWKGLRQELWADLVNPPRADNLLSDGMLPLAAVAGDDRESWFECWWNGYPGDLPDPIRRGLRELGLVGLPEHPLATGPAQGLLGWLWARELAAAPGSLGQGA